MINKIKIRLSILILSLVAIISIMTISISGEVKKISNASQDYKDKLIRFHVIANSDSDEDQNLKLKVRDAVINYLQPKLLESESIEESELIIKREYSELEKISKNIILQNGYNYDVKIGIDYSEFPTKQYSNVVLPAGEYKALKIIIGEGSGNITHHQFLPLASPISIFNASYWPAGKTTFAYCFVGKFSKEIFADTL